MSVSKGRQPSIAEASARGSTQHRQHQQFCTRRWSQTVCPAAACAGVAEGFTRLQAAQACAVKSEVRV